MSLSGTEKFIVVAAVGGIIATIASTWFTNKFIDNSTTGRIPQGAQVSNNSGAIYTPIGSNPDNALDYQSEVWRGPGNQQSNSDSNGQIYVKKFNKGGNHNSITNREQSGSFQSATKNPFANGTNNSYATAVNNATQDPTNQATSLVLGPGVAPNNVVTDG